MTGYGQAARPLVLTSLAPVYQLALPLLADTKVELRLLPDSPRGMQNHAALFVRQPERFADEFRAADAVISIGQAWPEDPLYVAARQFNIRVVNIDASKPYSHELDGVALARSPVSGAGLPQVWLSLANVLRMLDTMAQDLERLYPDEAEAIRRNLERSRAWWLALKADTERRLLTVDDPAIFALADEFTYLSNDLGLFVAGHFIKQDLDWTDADYTELTRTLLEGDIRVLVHKWEPSVQIQAAIATAGARLVVLDTLETSMAFAEGFQHNLESLMAALQAP